jgi:DNA-directed RNA polymerase specialized sigma24 family protein
MTARDRTSMGGSREHFETTDWGLVAGARTLHPDRRRAVLSELARQYWKPVYCYLRRKDYADDVAKDLTQGFFETIVLGNDLFQQADPAKGQFRTFLLTALSRYATSVHRAETAQKRRPEGGLVPLDGSESFQVPEPAARATPEGAFLYAWASDLLSRVIEEVEGQCRRNDQAVHWQAFEARVLGPIMEGADPPALPEVCARLGIAGESQASNLIVTVKRRFQVALRRRVRQVVGSDADVDGEIAELMAALSASGSGP